MKKIVALIMTVICFFGLTLELSGSDPDKKWSFRSYVEYVTENVEPFPSVELSLTFDEETTGIDRVIGFFEWLFGLIAYPLEVVATVIRNARVIFDGFFPVNWDFAGGSVPGASGGGGVFGDFGGGGHGGGGGTWE